MSSRAVACFTFDNMDPTGDDATLARGYAALYALLEAHEMRATFFVEGWNGEHRPDAVAEIVRRGHELGMHGWTHEEWHALEPSEEEALAARATEALERAAGRRPVGFRAPGGARTALTDSLLAKLGYRYDASLGEGMRPQRLSSGLVQVPFVWPGVDGFHYLRPEPARPADVRDGWLATLARVAERGGLFVTVCHAFITGVDEQRLAALDAVMRAAAADPRVSVRTVGEVAESLAGPGS
jgi:peptidoglycan/xylan/chitin deacetylase (PgdA/CDA1 family)